MAFISSEATTEQKKNAKIFFREEPAKVVARYTNHASLLAHSSTVMDGVGTRLEKRFLIFSPRVKGKQRLRYCVFTLLDYANTEGK